METNSSSMDKSVQKIADEKKDMKSLATKMGSNDQDETPQVKLLARPVAAPVAAAETPIANVTAASMTAEPAANHDDKEAEISPEEGTSQDENVTKDGNVTKEQQVPEQQEIINAPPSNTGQMTTKEHIQTALRVAKDRLHILQLDVEVTQFLKNPAAQELKLPPKHSYHRLLSHKVGELFGLTHVLDPTGKCVVYYKTPSTVWTDSLKTWIEEIPPKDPNQDKRKMKIMARKRNQKSGSGASSASQSAQSSGSSSPVMDKNQKARSLLEREEEYNKARARIFSDFEPPASDPTTTSSTKDDSTAPPPKWNPQHQQQHSGKTAPSAVRPAPSYTQQRGNMHQMQNPWVDNTQQGQPGGGGHPLLNDVYGSNSDHYLYASQQQHHHYQPQVPSGMMMEEHSWSGQYSPVTSAPGGHVQQQQQQPQQQQQQQQQHQHHQLGHSGHSQFAQVPGLTSAMQQASLGGGKPGAAPSSIIGSGSPAGAVGVAGGGVMYAAPQSGIPRPEQYGPIGSSHMVGPNVHTYGMQGGLYSGQVPQGQRRPYYAPPRRELYDPNSSKTQQQQKQQQQQQQRMSQQPVFHHMAPHPAHQQQQQPMPHHPRYRPQEFYS